MRPLKVREKGRRGSVGQSRETYNVGADLTTEDCVLGDHDGESQRSKKEILCETCLEERFQTSNFSRTKSQSAKRAWLAAALTLNYLREAVL